MLFNVRSKAPNFTTICQNFLLNTFQTLLNGSGLIHLFQSGPADLNDALTAASFVDASFPGYLPATVAVAATPLTGPQRLSRSYPMTLRYKLTAPYTPQQIQGYYVTDSGGEVWLAEYFDPPFAVANEGDSINFVFQFPINFLQSCE